MYYYHTHHITAVFTKQEQKEIAVNKSRPECGWFRDFCNGKKHKIESKEQNLEFESWSTESSRKKEPLK